MSTIPTMIAKDKGVHGLDMQADFDKFICADHASRKLVLRNRRDMYVCNGLNRNLTFVPLMPNIPVDPVTGIPKERVKTTTHKEKVLKTPASIAVTWKGGTTGSTVTQTMLNDYFIAKSGFGPDNGGELNKSIVDAFCEDAMFVLFGCVLVKDGGCGYCKEYGRFSVVTKVSSYSKTAPAVFSINGGYGATSNGSWYCGNCIGFTSLATPEFSDPCGGTWHYGRSYYFNGTLTVNYTPPVYEEVIVTDTVITPYIEYTVPDTNSNSPTDWTYDLTKLVASNEKVTGFLAYMEASDSTIGQLLVGYDTDPNIIVGTCTVIGKKDTTIPEMKYYSDSKKGVFVDIPVPSGTKIVKIQYLKSSVVVGDSTETVNPQKTYAYVYGYTKTKDLRYYDSRFSYSAPLMTETEFIESTLNSMTTYETTGGEIISDTPDTFGLCHALLQYSFALPADAEKFAKLYVTGEIYAERSNLDGVWKSFKYRLEPVSKTNFSIHREEFVGDDNIRYNRWFVAVSKYGYGFSVHVGIRNVLVQI